MDKHASPTRSHLFTVRLWVEESEASGPHWHGKLQDMANGRTAYFEDLQALVPVLQELLAAAPETQVQVSPPANSSEVGSDVPTSNLGAAK